MRVCEPWFGSNRVVVADSWFGSVSCVEELAEKGLHSVMSVKTNSRGFPKRILYEKVRDRE